MKILAINSSHRRDGATKRALDVFIDHVPEPYQVSWVDLIDLDIHYCRACMYCRETDGSCLQKDDMQWLIQEYAEADIILLGVPVYYNTVTSVLKTVIDRSLALHVSNKITEHHPERKKMVILSPGAGDYKSQYRSFPDVLEFYIQDLNADLISFVKMPKLGTKRQANIEPYKKDILHALRKCLR